LSLWSADEGSLMLWNLILAGFIAAVAWRFRHRRPETFPWAMVVLFAVQAFYLILVLGPTQPFATLATVPADGRGPLPLRRTIRSWPSTHPSCIWASSG
jgi:cytochrome c-type biogenesis protein CcmF